MLDEFEFLNDEELAKEIVITNTNLLADMFEKVEPLKDKLYTPTIENCDKMLIERVYKKAWPLEDILELFRKERGKHFDPVLVDLFLDNLDEFLEIRDKYKEIYPEDIQR